MSPEPIASLESVSVVYADGRVAVRDLTLAVMPGEVLMLLGRSGSGKTTTLKLLNALVRATSGRVVVHGREVGAWAPHLLRRRIGWVIQEVGLFPHFTVAENVALVPSLERWERARVEARVDALLALVGLEPARFRDLRPRALSGGERQRVGLARALAAEPPLLLLDEPFAALDPLTRAELQGEFAALVRRLGTTAVFVTHDGREAVRLGSRLALLAAGGVVYEGPPAGLRTAPHPEARAFAQALE